MPLTGNPNARNQLKLAGLLLVTAGVFYLCYRILLPFFPALTWAIALAVVTRPLHRVLDRHLRNRTASSLLAVLIITVALVLPLTLVTERIVTEAVNAVRTATSPDFRLKIDNSLAAHPKVMQAINWVQQRVNISEQAQSIAGSASGAIQA